MSARKRSVEDELIEILGPIPPLFEGHTKIEDLPFHRELEAPGRNGRMISWWEIEGDDHKMGQIYAMRFLDFLAADVNGRSRLPSIVRDMGGEVNAGAITFLLHIERAAVYGRQMAWLGALKGRKAMRQYLEKEAAERSERSRRASQARWAKRTTP